MGTPPTLGGRAAVEVAGLLVGQQRTRWNCVKPGPPGASGPCPCSATQRPWWWSQGPRGPRAWKPDPGPGDWAPTSWEISTCPRHSVSTEVLWPQGGPVPSWPGVLAVGRGFARGLVRICPGGSGPLQPAEGTGGSDRFGSTGPPCTPEGVPLGRGAEFSYMFRSDSPMFCWLLCLAHGKPRAVVPFLVASGFS